MATGTQGAPAANRSPGELIQYEQFIDAQLRRTGNHVRSADLTASLILLAIGGAGFFLAAALLDHWAFPGGMGMMMRAAMFALGLAALGGHLWRSVGPLAIRKINPVYAAQTIERSQSSLKNSLVNFLFFRARPGEVSAVVYEAIEEQAATRLARVPADSAVDRTKLIRLGYALLAILSIAAGYKLLSPKDPFQTASRVLLPWARIAAPTVVAIESIEPGDATVVHGASLSVSAVIRGLSDGESAAIVFSTTDQPLVERRLPMSAPSGDLRHAASLPGGDGIQQPLVYRIEAGDAVSPNFRVDVSRAPTISVRRVDYEYPAYTGLSQHSVEQQGDIKAIEGTQVTIHATANDEIAAGHIAFVDRATSQQSLTARGAEAKTSFRLSLADDRRTSQPSGYSLHFANRAGQQNQQAVRHQIEVAPDLAPIVEFLAPQSNTLDVPLGKSLKIELAAHDPDFGLRRVRIVGEVEGRRVFEKLLLDDLRRGQFTGEYRFDPRTLQLESGQIVECWAETEDNREPTSNRAETAARKRIRIVAAGESGSRETSDAADAGQPAADGAGKDNPPEASPPSDDRPAEAENQDRPSANATPSRDRASRQPDRAQRRPNQDQRPDENRSAGEQSAGDEHGSGADGQNSGGQSDQGGSQSSGSGGKQGKRGQRSAAGDDQRSADPDEQSETSEEGAGGQEGEGGDRSAAGSRGGRNPPSGSGDSSAAGQADGRSQGGAQRSDRSPSNERPSTPIDKDGASDGDAFEQILRHRDEQQRGEGKSDARDSTAQQRNDPSRTAKGERDAQRGSDARQGPDAASERNDRTGAGGKQSPDQGESGSRHDRTGQDDPHQRGDSDPSPGADQPAGEQRGDDPSGAKNPRDGSRQRGDENPPPDGSRPDSAAPGGAEDRAASDPTDERRTGDQGEQTQTGGTDERRPPRGQGQSADRPTDRSTGQQPKESPAVRDRGERATDDQQRGDDAGSPEAQRDQRNRETNPQSPGTSEPSQPQSPSNSREQSKSSNGKRGESGDQSGAGGQGGGQKGAGAGQGEQGQNTPNDEGSSRADEPGDGETGERAGRDQPADDKTGKSGDRRGPGSNRRPGGEQADSAETSGAESPPGARGDQEPPQGNDDARRAARDSGDGTAPGGGGDRAGSADRAPSSGEAREDEANLDYARRATELALEHLEHELHKDQPDQGLLDRLGWTKDDLRRFVERWQVMLEKSGARGAASEPAARELDQALRSLGLRPRSASVRGKAANADKLQRVKESRRSAPPPEYQEHFKAYQQGAARAGK